MTFRKVYNKELDLYGIISSTKALLPYSINRSGISFKVDKDIIESFLAEPYELLHEFDNEYSIERVDSCYIDYQYAEFTENLYISPSGEVYFGINDEAKIIYVLDVNTNKFIENKDELIKEKSKSTCTKLRYNKYTGAFGLHSASGRDVAVYNKGSEIHIVYDYNYNTLDRDEKGMLNSIRYGDYINLEGLSSFNITLADNMKGDLVILNRESSDKLFITRDNLLVLKSYRSRNKSTIVGKL